MNFKVHDTAIIDSGAKIGKDTKIWHWAHVCSGAKIGHNVVLGQNVFVGNNVEIGNYCKIQNNVSIYDNVFLEDAVFCGPRQGDRPWFAVVGGYGAGVHYGPLRLEFMFESSENFRFRKPKFHVTLRPKNGF